MSLIADESEYMEIQPGDAYLRNAESGGDEPEGWRSQRCAGAPGVMGGCAVRRSDEPWLKRRRCFSLVVGPAVGQESHVFRPPAHQEPGRCHDQRQCNQAD